MEGTEPAPSALPATWSASTFEASPSVQEPLSIRKTLADQAVSAAQKDPTALAVPVGQATTTPPLIPQEAAQVANLPSPGHVTGFADDSSDSDGETAHILVPT
ncbi:hypothetical protein EC991_008888 [Linnemannia zychae]|nr:hypothetical protein EC991_008888 [Linnemannia zychae]